MKVIINTINIYNIHDNRFIICGKSPNTNEDKVDDRDLTDIIIPHIVVNENNDHPLIAQLEARILQSDCEKNELIKKLNEENNTGTATGTNTSDGNESN